jgi:GNAT superfamily N-acetyltransferase
VSLNFRDATTVDLDVLVAFGAELALETENLTLDPLVHREGVRLVLGDPNRGRYWIAEDAGQAIGTLMVTREWSDWRSGWMWWIQSVFVQESARGQGVYRALYASIVEQARSAGDVFGIRLYVDQDNQPAQAVYAALGMSQSHYHMYEVEFPREDRT